MSWPLAYEHYSEAHDVKRLLYNYTDEDVYFFTPGACNNVTLLHKVLGS